jgi:hypothetical protein
VTIAARLAELERRIQPPLRLPERTPLELARAAIGEPDDWQRRLLESKAPRILINVGRQMGKSTTCAVLAVHTALYEPSSLTLIVSRAERQSSELISKAKSIFGAIGRPVAADAESVLQLRLRNGSRIIALPGREETIRAYSGVRLLLLDEAARVSDATYYSCRPMLAVSQGRLIALSTPFGRRGWWYEAFLAEERAALGTYWYSQEYECSFNAASDSVFNAEAVERAFSGGVLPLFDLQPAST